MCIAHSTNLVILCSNYLSFCVCIVVAENVGRSDDGGATAAIVIIVLLVLAAAVVTGAVLAIFFYYKRKENRKTESFGMYVSHCEYVLHALF